MANGEGVGGQIVGWALAAATGLAAAVYGWATWTLRAWVRESIRLATDEQKRRLDTEWTAHKRDLDNRFDALESQAAGAAGALEERTRKHDEQIARNRERYVLVRNDHESLVREFYRLRQKVEGGVSEVWRRHRDENGDDDVG